MSRPFITIDKDYIRERITISPTGCWEWNNWCGPRGYGYTTIQNGFEGKRTWKVSRLVYRLWYPDRFDDNLCVLHKCDNPPCCNPNHLFLGSNGDNTRDMLLKGRHRRVLTNEQVRFIRTSDLTVSELAKRFDVSIPVVSSCRLRKTYQHL